ncbi:MAG: type II toxin-antitoxin system VapC family toxin [Bryobacterales bacterium]|nr:type II toxin-antitoxin system VapC family toxin [Bryobacterales bacterium]
MKAILDTHVWLWYLLGDERLTDEQRQCIEDESVELWLSPMSIWETHLLLDRGRIPIAETPARWIDRALQRLAVREAALTHEIAIRSRTVLLEHGDPADRFIAATAVELKAKLLTSDERLLRCTQLECIC